MSLACEAGSYRVHGPGTARFVATLSGSGFVGGPGGWCIFIEVDMRFTPHDVVARATPGGAARDP